MKMETITSVTDFPTGLSSAIEAGQESFARATRGCERLMTGLMQVAMQQFELAQGAMEANLADLDLLMKARTPDALVTAEFEVVRRRTERAADAARKISVELSRTWSETAAFVMPGGSLN
jgi:hypothetical protein